MSLMETNASGGDGHHQHNSPNPPVPIVELTVKSASSNAIDDLIIQCENLWTVKQLKERITEQYPCKLKIEEQKLIYSGKLLTDDLILKDILRSFDDPEINKKQKHIFHLVYSTKTKQPVPTPSTNQTTPTPPTTTPNVSITSTDGLRQRNVPQTVEPVVAASSSSNAANMFNFPGGPAAPQYFLAQQMAMHNWMQQVYWQYMNQYMNSTNTSENRPQGPQFIPQNFFPQMPTMPYFPAANFPQATPQTSQPEPQPQVAAPAQPQPRFPNIVQEEQENRDWLDIFYLGCRLLLFLMLIYFYSSATRCILVIGGAIGIYMYHNGYFRNRNPAETNNNNVNNNNRNNVEGEAVQEGEQQPLVEGGVAGADTPEGAAVRTESRVPETTAAATAAQNPGTSVMSIIKTFVVTFITSLLPDTQTL